MKMGCQKKDQEQNAKLAAKNICLEKLVCCPDGLPKERSGPKDTKKVTKNVSLVCCPDGLVDGTGREGK